MNIALLFEQSGTFKKQLQAIGHNAKDFDICNDYGETDYIVDLFDMIDNNKLDVINKADLVIAFFPCTWFSDQNDLIYRKQLYQFRTWDDDKIEKYIHERALKEKEVSIKLLKLIDNIKVPLIIENPNSRRINKYLSDCESVLHKRSLYGDYFDKLTRYFLFNGVKITEPDRIKNCIHARIKYSKEMKMLKGTRKMKRSLIAPEYVNNLIKHIYVNGTNLYYGGD